MGVAVDAGGKVHLCSRGLPAICMDRTQSIVMCRGPVSKSVPRTPRSTTTATIPGSHTHTHTGGDQSSPLIHTAQVSHTLTSSPGCKALWEFLSNTWCWGSAPLTPVLEYERIRVWNKGMCEGAKSNCTPQLPGMGN